MLTAVGFSTRALVQCAARERINVYAFDCCGDLDTRELAAESTIIDLTDVAWLHALNTHSRIMLAGGLEDNQSMLKQLSQFDPLLVPEKYREIRSWNNWKKWSHNAGLQFPQTYPPRDLADMLCVVEPNISSSLLNKQWLWKKHGSGGGLGVKPILVDHRAGCPDLGNTDLTEPGIVQERLSGQGLSVSYISSEFGTIMLGAAKPIDLSPHIWSDFIYRGSIAPYAIPETWRLELDQFGREVGFAVDWRGLWQADFLLQGDDLYMLEINPRWTASMELLSVSLELPLVDWHLHSPSLKKDRWQSMADQLALVSTSSRPVYRKEILYAETEQTVSNEDVRRWWDARWFAAISNEHGPWFADIPPVGAHLQRGAPTCSIITRWN